MHDRLQTTALCNTVLLNTAGRIGAFALGIIVTFGSASAADLPAFNNGNWPFCPPQRPAVPVVANATWVANPIDAFILAKLESQGLTPNQPADRLTLLRRVTFDLTGLPPTLAEQAAFLADDTPAAYERLVDRLLDSPHYGERWAQHWLDVVSYAETDGFKDDDLRPDAHKYRDYVIRSFNADLPYDRFIRQQLAGDELEPDNPEALIATGLNRMYPDETNAADLQQRRQEIHDNLTDSTALTFLGLTVGCAQCHDHKFDPITQVDYFRLQAFFATLLPRDEVPVATREQIEKHAQQQAQWEQVTHEIRSELDALLAVKRARAKQGALEKFAPHIRLAVDTPEGERTCMQKQVAFQALRFVLPKMAEVDGDSLKGEQKQRFGELQNQLAEFGHLKPAPIATAMAVTDASPVAPPTHRLTLGDYRKPQEEVQPGFPAFLGASEPLIENPPGVPQSTGRRAALAHWLCRPDHPLTARVMVNRLWKHHFGRGIVATPNDFGAMGEAPTHPELLDWLAVEFVEQGWSLKAMHRLMLTSATYRQSSRMDFDNPVHARALELDGGNRLLWHAHRRRLEGEAIRDAILQVSGDLTPRMFGPSAKPEIPQAARGRAEWEIDESPQDRNRRSIYIFAKRNLRFPLFELFDQPDLHNSCPERSATTTAPQALALLNGEFSLDQAERWSRRLTVEFGDDSAAIVHAVWQAAFARSPSSDESAAAQAFLRQQRDALVATAKPGVGTPPATAALVDFCHAIFNGNEFLYVD